ncbi:unnamed protein product [Caenorhabditis bovis]|uniref:PDZ domain-containing protein n=1 Tax=Caenorhabditis bovis TaxID=2654633 RepID=A0A8S1FCV6_9PELO|nr:unnamed protein product [Caenorhabditis bovis]
MDWSESGSAATFTTPTTSFHFENSGASTSEQLFCGEDISNITVDGLILPDLDGDAAQRSVLLARSSLDDSFGFALQSYVFKRASTDSYERITYVDYVSTSSPASRAGVRRGDMVIAVNGQCVITSSHTEIVAAIAQSLHVTLVLVFKDVARIVGLTMRSIQLNCLLKEKERELDILEEEEMRLMEKLKKDDNSRYYEVDEDKSNRSCSSSSSSSEEGSCIIERQEGGGGEKEIDGVNNRHLFRINSGSSFGSPQVTRL